MATIALIMLLIWGWQTLAFSLTAHIMLDETIRVRPELVAIAALLATVVLLVDSFTVIRASHFLAGLAQLKRGGLEAPGYFAAKIKNSLQYLFRFPLAAVFAELAAIGLLLFCFASEILRQLTVNGIKENAPLELRHAAPYDAGTARLVAQIEHLQAVHATAQTDAGNFRRDTLQAPKEDPELKPATEQLRRTEAAKVEAERRLARMPLRDTAERRLAQQRVAARQAAFQAAHARLEKVREMARTAMAQRRNAVQGRLDETLGAEQRYQDRIDALEKEYAARLANREANIRAAMERDPGYRPVDHGLLARAKVLAQLMEDPWVFTVAMLLHAGLFGIELGAVLCKALTSVPSAYAVLLASEEYANDVETVNAVFKRIGGTEPPEPAEELPADPEPRPPEPGDAAAAVSEAANEDMPEEDSTAERLAEGARSAKAQAVARAKSRKQRSRPADAEPTSLADVILDGPVRRGRGRPPGAKNKPKPDNDAGLLPSETDAA